MTRLVLLLVFASSRLAFADGDPTALEATGNKHYELAEYAAAIADFKEAFRISDRPELLFNIAQAYRLANDCASARTFYKTYLRRVPDAANAANVKTRIDEMDACVAKAPATAPTEPTAPAGPPTPAVPTAPIATPPTRSWKTTAGYATVGAGVLATGLGVVFARRGSSKADELRDACAIDCTGATARALDEAGHAANRNAAIGFVVGGGLVATGVVLLVLDRRTERARVAIGPHGATASWTWTF